MIKFKMHTIRSRLLVGFVLIALLPLIGATIASLMVGIVNGRQQATERLQSVAASREQAVKRWLDSLQQELTVVAYSDCSNERIGVVTDLASENKYLDFYSQAIRNRFQNFVEQSPDLTELFLIDVYGRVVLSTDRAQEAREVVGEPFFRYAWQGPRADLMLPESQGDVAPDAAPVVVSAPVASLVGAEGGIIAGRAQIGTLLELLDDRTGLGETGKVYLVNGAGTVLAGTGAGAIVPTTGSTRALAGRIDLTGVYQDQHGKRVIGVYRWLPELGVLLAVEQDQAEAFETITATLGINLVVALSALLLAVGLSFAIVRGIVNPLAELADTATRIAAGELDRVAPVEREDEIGVLARAFNSMTTQLSRLISSLERRVTERTQELEQLALQLETSARVGREVTSILEINELLSKVTELIQRAFDYYGVHIFLVDEETEQLVYRGSKQQDPHDLVLAIGPDSLNGKAVLQNQAQLANRVTKDPSYRQDRHYPATRSELVVPLRIGRRVIGTLDLLQARNDSFRPEDVMVAQSLGDQIAIAIENARLYDRSRELGVLEERNRLARELHDSMNQSLYSVVLFTGAAYNEAEAAGAESIQRYLARAERMAQQALKEMRLLVFELRPFELSQKGFVGALQERLEAVESRAGVDVELLVDPALALPDEIKESLFRIVQEALNNVLKHARASRVTVQMTQADNQVQIQVRDNGVGFDPAAMEQRGGIGLASMSERAGQLGGLLEIQSAPGQGTCVTISFVLPQGGSG